MAEDLKRYGGDRLKPKVVLAVAAHPDDFEYFDFGIAGTIAKWVKDGSKAFYLILTNGNKGSSNRALNCAEIQKIRQQEQRAAGNVLGLSDVFFCNYEDGLLMVNADVKRDIVRIIRKVRPDVVITTDPSILYSLSRGIVNHSDHRAAGEATIDAVYPLSRDHLSFPELLHDEKLEPHRVSTLLLSNFEQQNYYVDISNEFDTRIKALAEHKSQILDFGTIEGQIRATASELGAKVGAKYAEGYLRIDFPF
ncbi:MAG TPA: PIG-L deacetylase family protein [Candidatus Saccharimonadales bacterium]|nr:PIG-L deacetylase family protein [Candidatus Saccharimonadales bacterium]